MSDTTTEGRTSPPSSGGQQADREMSDAEVAKEMGDKPPLPKLLSPSRMKDYMQCPKKFHFKSVLRLPDPPGPAAARGTLAHQVLEELFKLPRDQRTVEQAVALVEPEWVKLCADREEYAEMAPPGSELESEVLEFAADVVERYFNIEDPTKFDATELELKLTPKLAKDLRTIGYIDRLDIIEHDDDEFPFITDYKGLALDTPLPTPTGWTTMADVQEGDLLYDADGQPTTVIAKSQVHHRRCYRIEFDDATEIICDNEHMWQIDVGTAPHAEKTKVLNADELYALARENETRTSRRKFIIWNSKPLEADEIDVLVDPYVLGAWLGDGRSRDGEFHSLSKDDAAFLIEEFGRRGESPFVSEETEEHMTFRVPRPDSEACVRGHGPKHRYGSRPDGRPGDCSTCIQSNYEGERVNGSLRDRLEMLGVLHNKHVPAAYLRGSKRQRLDLLQGLMDTDGHWNPTRNRAVFVTTTPALAEAVAELVHSLGWRSYTWFNTYTKSDGEEKQAFQVWFTPTDEVPFKLPVKANTVTSPKARTPRRRAIKSIEPIDSVPTQCVAVDSPDSLYLAGRQMVPTHNTGKLPNPRYMDETWFAMKVYAVMLLAERKQEPFKLRLVYLQGDTPEEAVYTLEVTDALLKHTRKKVLSIWRDMKKRHRNDDWPTKTGPLCDWCAYQDICPAFAPEVDGALAEADPNYRS